MKKFFAKVGINQRHSSMNPIEYWWKTNKVLGKRPILFLKKTLRF